MPLYK